jgi:uncharacterized membrane protein (UPF0136 family)
LGGEGIGGPAKPLCRAMAWLTSVLLLYGLLSIGLGLYGYLAKGSLVSLIAGGVAGVIVIGAAALARTHPKIGLGIGLVVALILIGRFAGPLVRDQQIVPAGIMAVSSLIVAALLLYALFVVRR